MAENQNIMDKVVALAKRRGFFYPGSEIYGGLANTYDYGPVGTELLRNIKDLWWKHFVQQRPDMVGLDAGIISHHKIWEASGHVAGFADAMIDCKNCQARMRADHLIEDYLEENGKDVSKYNLPTILEEEWGFKTVKEIEKIIETQKVEGLAINQLEALIKFIFKIKCPNCKKIDWTDVRKFNQLFPVQLGIVQGEGGMGYLRGETAQGIFVNFRNVVDSNRVRLPFGIAQIGKGFRNEITPGNAIFRTIEFDMGEIEYFFDPKTTEWEELFEKWQSTLWDFVTKKLGVLESNLRWRVHTDEERSFYSTKTVDLDYKFPFGFKELWGLAYRTNYDLTKHAEYSKKELVIQDPQTNEKIVPHVIEPAVGLTRMMLMVLADAYTEEDPSTSFGNAQDKGSGQGRTVLKINPNIAPYKVAIFPLLANKEPLVAKAKELYDSLKEHFMVTFDARGNIGKRYLAQDEIGTPWCVTVDFDSLDDDTVTVRDRDTTKQERVAIKDLVSYIQQKLQ